MPISPAERATLAHLLRRAGFGARPREWDEYSRLGVAATTQQLLHPENTPDNLDQLLQTLSGNFIDFNTIEGVRNWWIFRMAQTSRPLEEKMTLFWHNHFATANYKVKNSALMNGQINTFRANALGSFRSLLLDMTRDPAMLIWLDGDQNKLGAPNENFGREVMELFTMGVGGGYTENDVKEGARALTGWVYDRAASKFVFNPFVHDDGWKTFLGQGGNFHADDIIDILVRQPATAKHLATKLWKFFVSDAPPPAAIERIAKAYFASGYSVRAMMESIFTSTEFNSPEMLYSQIKSPVEYVVGIMRTLDVPLLAVKDLGNVIQTMGQDLLNPPNVAGWPGGREWINTRTLLARVNFSSQVTGEMNKRGQLVSRVKEELLLPGASTQSPADAMQSVWNAFLPGRPMNIRESGALLAYLQEGQGKQSQFNFNRKLPGLVNLVFGAPDYQLA